MTLWVGIDPSTTKCGVAWLGETELYTMTLEQEDPEQSKRMIRMMQKLKEEIFISYYFEADIRIICEEPYLPGQGHDTLNRLLGMIQYEFYNQKREVQMVHPMTLKKYFGSGKLDKKELANRIKKKLPSLFMKRYIQRLIKEKRWDETDAIAVAVYGKETSGREKSK